MGGWDGAYRLRIAAYRWAEWGWQMMDMGLDDGNVAGRWAECSIWMAGVWPMDSPGWGGKLRRAFFG